VGILFIVLGFLGKVPALLAVMPRSVMVPARMFVVSFIIINGLQVMTSRLLDARRTLVIGLSVVAGVAVEAFPTLAASAPKILAPVVGSSLVFSTLIALTLNLLFRIGVRRSLTTHLEPGTWDLSQIETTLRTQGATWGARVDIINDASWAICQVVEAVAENCWHAGTLTIQTSFDEFNLDVSISYRGELLEFTQLRPTDDEIISSEDGVRRLAGHMLRHVSDKAGSQMKDGRPLLTFRFDH
jgi:xanthine permease XanP